MASRTKKCCSEAGVSLGPGYQDCLGRRGKPTPPLAMVSGEEPGHMHPQERDVRVGKCPGLSDLHSLISHLYYSSNPGLKILGGWGVGMAEAPENVSSPSPQG